VFGIDPAFVEALPPGSPSQYVLRLQPLTEEREVTITLRYSPSPRSAPARCGS